MCALASKQEETELRAIKKEIAQLKRRLKVLEARRAEIE
jgi:hypothetical protein